MTWVRTQSRVFFFARTFSHITRAWRADRSYFTRKRHCVCEVAHSDALRVAFFSSYHTLTSSVIFYLTEAWQHGINFFKGIMSYVTIRQKAAMKHYNVNSEELLQPLNLPSCWWFRAQRGHSLSMVIHGHWSNVSVVLLLQMYLFPCVQQGSSHGHCQRWKLDRCSKEQIMGTESRHHFIEKTDH